MTEVVHNKILKNYLFFKPYKNITLIDNIYSKMMANLCLKVFKMFNCLYLMLCLKLYNSQLDMDYSQLDMD